MQSVHCKRGWTMSIALIGGHHAIFSKYMVLTLCFQIIALSLTLKATDID